jgi:hypothetical protein
LQRGKNGCQGKQGRCAFHIFPDFENTLFPSGITAKNPRLSSAYSGQVQPRSS